MLKLSFPLHWGKLLSGAPESGDREAPSRSFATSCCFYGNHWCLSLPRKVPEAGILPPLPLHPGPGSRVRRLNRVGESGLEGTPSGAQGQTRGQAQLLPGDTARGARVSGASCWRGVFRTTALSSGSRRAGAPRCSGSAEAPLRCGLGRKQQESDQAGPLEDAACVRQEGGGLLGCPPLPDSGAGQAAEAGGSASWRRTPRPWAPR